MADGKVEVSDATGESLKTKFQEFLGGLTEDENALFAAMVAGGDAQEGDDVSGYFFNFNGWGNWWSGSYSGVISTGGGNFIGTNTGNFSWR